MTTTQSPEERLKQTRARMRLAMQHPDSLVTHAARAALMPIAQRSPVGLVLVAFAAGGLLVAAKPWRWNALATMVAGAVPQVLNRWMAQVQSVTPKK
jgi:hypothetical protein